MSPAPHKGHIDKHFQDLLHELTCIKQHMLSFRTGKEISVALNRIERDVNLCKSCLPGIYMDESNLYRRSE